MKKSHIPNLFTFANLSCGIFSLLFTLNYEYNIACLFILLAGIIDRYDGRIARFLNVDSEIGKELDSLADLVSFGVAPAFVAFLLFQLINLPILGYVILVLFPIAGAFRLARYNISDFDGVYTGVPITLAGTFLAVYSLIFTMLGGNITRLSWLTLFIMAILAYLMISKFRFSKI